MSREEYPLGRDRQIWVSPDRCWGAPCQRDSRLPTWCVWSMWQAGETVDEIAFCYSAPREFVLDAIEYESLHEGFAPEAEGMGVLLRRALGMEP